MADNLLIYQICGTCDGTGSITINDQPYDPGPPESVTCSDCAGEGRILWGEMKEIEAEP